MRRALRWAASGRHPGPVPGTPLVPLPTARPRPVAARFRARPRCVSRRLSRAWCRTAVSVRCPTRRTGTPTRPRRSTAGSTGRASPSPGSRPGTGRARRPGRPECAVEIARAYSHLVHVPVRRPRTVIDERDASVVGQGDRHAHVQMPGHVLVVPQAGLGEVLTDLHEDLVHHRDVVQAAQTVPQRQERSGGQRGRTRWGNRMSCAVVQFQEPPELRVQGEAQPRFQCGDPFGVRRSSQSRPVGGRMRRKPRLEASPLVIERGGVPRCHVPTLEAGD